MAAVQAIAATDDGRWIAWSEAGRLVVVETARRVQVAELAIQLQPPVALALSTDPDRLVVVHTRGAATLVRVLSMPDLEPLAEGTLPASARLVAVCGATAVLLGSSDVLTLLDLATLHSTTLTVRGPIQAVAAFSASQIIVAARGKLETWSLEERRPTHRLSFALPKQPTAVGVAANGSLLWTASGDGTISCHRLSDGTLVSEGDLGARGLVLSASRTQSMLVARMPEAAQELLAYDLLTGALHTRAVGTAIAAACVVGTVAVVLPEQDAPLLVSLAGPDIIRPLVLAEGMPVAAAPEAEDVETVPPPADPAVASRLAEWRAQVRAAVEATTSAPPAADLAPRAPTDITPRRPTDEPKGARAKLVAWAAVGKASAPPPVPKLDELAQRFSLDVRSCTLLSVLYAAWLEGDGKVGVPVAQAARALGNDEPAWTDALAQGRLGTLGWVRADYGRLRLRPPVGRFLDEAAPAVRLIAPAAGSTRTAEPPSVASQWDRHGADLDVRLRELADACQVLVAAIDLDALPAARFDRALDARLLEARLHGALPVLHAIGQPAIDAARLAEPMLLTSRTVQIEWAKLPSWPRPAEREAFG